MLRRLLGGSESASRRLSDTLRSMGWADGGGGAWDNNESAENFGICYIPVDFRSPVL